MGKNPTISAVICTYDSQGRIGELLENLAGQGRRPDRVIVVDNNSTDRTIEIVNDFAKENPGFPLKLVSEPRQGKTHALNAGVKAAETDVIAFLDDDVLPDKGWTAAIVQAFADDNIDGLGGRIIPKWTGKSPKWFTPAVAGFTPVHDFGEKTMAYAPPASSPIGANMAFRKKALDRAGIFDARLGHKGKTLVGGEESELCQRMADMGMQLVYRPGAKAAHCFSPEAEKKVYWRKRVFIQGRTAARYLKNNERPLFTLAMDYIKNKHGKKKSGGKNDLQPVLYGDLKGKNLFYRQLKLILYLGFIAGLVDEDND